ncbi:succinyldiaminopimelate transaminase [Nakamurella sp. UYEF19]|uniref:succinyldiaminopimelate transaminase n=1 Tax=Nakamurella sp. UYEF19 TaxID=1756392 RepID=UPI003392DB85
MPQFPWDQLADAGEVARAHPQGIVDLSVGTPVDPVPSPVRAALANASNAPGYPTVHGSAELRQSYSQWMDRSHGVGNIDPVSVLPTIGSKELVAALPVQLGIGAGDVVVIPEIAYPTYEVGALMAGATVVRADRISLVGHQAPALIWLNSPSNPTGKVLSTEHLAKVVGWARSQGSIVVSDECYIDLGWDSAPVSILHREVCGGDFTGLLAVHSLSKRSNMAGYRAGFISGDPELVASLLALRRHLGLMLPTPIQAAAAAALDDDGHVMAQRNRYGERRAKLMSAFENAGFSVGHSEAGLYLWCTRGEPAIDSVNWLAQRGILVAPGTFYGPGGASHIRVAFTATDERVDSAVARLSA